MQAGLIFYFERFIYLWRFADRIQTLNWLGSQAGRKISGR